MSGRDLMRGREDVLEREGVDGARVTGGKECGGGKGEHENEGEE